MGFKCGLVGLPNVGKSTLFSALSNLQVDRANFPFCTVEPNVGVVPVKDERLDKVAQLVDSSKITPATLEMVDIAGLIKGASKGEGLGNRFLASIREMDVLVHVIRGFNAPAVSHLPGDPDPDRDMEIVETELILADLATLDKRKERNLRAAKGGGEAVRKELSLLENLYRHLDTGNPAISFVATAEEKEVIASWQLLTAKPVIYVLNMGEECLLEDNFPLVQSAKRSAEKRNSPLLTICAALEAELLDLDPEERDTFLVEYGLQETGLHTLIQTGYKLLGLVTFFTIKGKEARAWAVKNGTPAVKGAGKVHSDMERGFITAEVISWKDLLETGSLTVAKEKGILRVEGKGYIIKDGDVILFRFKV